MPVKLKGRYELRRPIEQGGMGVVYEAFDHELGRAVAVKTVFSTEQGFLDLFDKEWSKLAALSHPNIVAIIDRGTYEEAGVIRPFFVMPLLNGTTLAKLLKSAGAGLPVERVGDIISQACRGLQGAHERGIVHRDVKPSNLFVLDDGSVQVIDFGLAHAMNAESSLGMKGTLLYMAPEQLESKPPTAWTDIFALGVVAYEALAGSQYHPFRRDAEREIDEAILNHFPPPLTELNANVSLPLARVVHKAMAKQPHHRFGSAREMGETLQKALRGEPIGLFDPARVGARVERARRKFAAGDLALAQDILREIESEGDIDLSIPALRGSIQAAMRERTLAQLLASARSLLEAGEFPRALQKLQEVLAEEPHHTDALTLKQVVESRRAERQFAEHLRLAREWCEAGDFPHARGAVHDALQMRPRDAQAEQLLEHIKQAEREHGQLRQQQERLQEEARAHHERGEVSAALGKLEEALRVEGRFPNLTPPDAVGAFHAFHRQVMAEDKLIHDAHGEGRRHLSNHNFDRAEAIAEEFLRRYPGHPLFEALKRDADEQRRQEIGTFIAETDRRMERELNLDRQVELLREAAERSPHESRLHVSLRLAREKRDRIETVVAKARLWEEQGRYRDALGQWELIAEVYPQQPGLASELERLQDRLRQQERAEWKVNLVAQIDHALQTGQWDQAGALARHGRSEFPNDREFAELQRLAEQGIQRPDEAARLHQLAQDCRDKGREDEALALLRQALSIHPANAVVRTALCDLLLARAERLSAARPEAAAVPLAEALLLAPDEPKLRAFQERLDERAREAVREQQVVQCLARAGELRDAGSIGAARLVVDAGLAQHPAHVRLVEMRAALQRLQPAPPRRLSELPQLPRADEELPPQLAGWFTAEAAQPVPGGPVASSMLADAPDRPASIPVDLPGARGTNGTAPAGHEEQPHDKARLAWVIVPLGTLARRARTMPTWGRATLLVAAVLLGAGVAGRYASRARPVQVPTAQSHVVALSVRPQDAVLSVDGRSVRGVPAMLDLPAGAHRVTASKEGFAAEERSFTLPGTAVVEFALQPLPHLLVLSADEPDAQVAIDEGKATTLPGQAVPLQPGEEHTLRLSHRDRAATVRLYWPPGKLPEVRELSSLKQAELVVVSTLGQRGRLHTQAGLAVSVGSRRVGVSSANGLDLPAIGTQTALRLGEDEQRQSFLVDADRQPRLFVFARFQSRESTGTVLVTTGEEGAQVLVDGVPQRQQTAGGRLAVPLTAGQYVIRVQKAGYRSEPARRTVSVTEGTQEPVVFRLTPVTASAKAVVPTATPAPGPASPILVIRDAPAGAKVLLDGTEMGTVSGDGTFRLAERIAPGERTLQLALDGHTHQPVRRMFASGAQTIVNGDDARLAPAFGVLELTVTPSWTLLSAHRPGRPERALRPGRQELPAGDYIIRASAPGYADMPDRRVVIGPGATSKEEIVLRRPLRAAAP